MVKEEKIRVKEEVKKMMENFEVFGFIDLFSLPSKQFQEIRRNLRDVAKIKVVKKNIIIKVLEELKKSFIIQKIPLQPALIFSNLEPLKLYSLIAKFKTKDFASEGSVAEDDIEVKAGITNLNPGPAISELSKVGLAVGVEEGKIAIKKDKILVKKGEIISKEVANVLKKLGIQAKTIKLNVKLLCKKDEIYDEEILSYIGEFYLNKLKESFQKAFNFSVNLNYPTKQTIRTILIKAFQFSNIIKNIGG